MASLQKQVKKLNIDAQKKHQDFDPEDELYSKQAASDEDSEDDQSADERLGRAHYQAVDKSKLRKPEKIRLDEKKYSGQAVSRDKIFQHDDSADALAPATDDDDDPFAAPTADKVSSEEDSDDEDEVEDLEDFEGDLGSDDEIDSDEAFEEGEEEALRGKGFVFRGSGKDLKSLPVGDDDEDEDETGMSDGQDSLEASDESVEEQSDTDMDVDGIDDAESAPEDDDGDEDESEGENEDDDESNARPRPSTIRPTGTTDREKLKALISEDTAALASSLHATLSADAQKGAAVKKQYQTFDRLLDARIKLQKGLTASNDLQIDPKTTDEEAQLALKKAEEAALKLYATIESLRHSILEANTSSTNTTTEPNPNQTSKKRKRPPPPTQATSTNDLWSRLQTLETQTTPTRSATLDKWSLKTRAAAPLPPSSNSKLSSTSTTSDATSKLTTILSAYLATELPKLQSTSQPTRTTYEDTNFYQSLLRDLINSRAAAANGNGNQSSTNVPVVPSKLHLSGNANKSRQIDTKASKGRKIRYTVHEKLESFMAGEGRGNTVGQWNDGAVREFFGSLLGQRGMLVEGEVGNGDGDGDVAMGGDDEGEEQDREFEALRLFRT